MTKGTPTEEFTAPTHVGIVLDGNRRWAKERGLPSNEGHSAGAQAIEPAVRAAFDRGVQYVSLFVFSTENWKRAEQEVGYLMKLFIHYFKKESQKLIRDGFKILFAGQRDDRIRKDIRKAIDELEESSKNGQNGTVIFNFNYGGHTEIVDAVKSIIKEGITANEIDERVLAAHMYTPEVPELDLIIRTSGEQRISGFQLWRAAYAEFLFVDTLWPDFKPVDMDQALDIFNERNRRFGS